MAPKHFKHLQSFSSFKPLRVFLADEEIFKTLRTFLLFCLVLKVSFKMRFFFWSVKLDLSHRPLKLWSGLIFVLKPESNIFKMKIHKYLNNFQSGSTSRLRTVQVVLPAELQATRSRSAADDSQIIISTLQQQTFRD